VAVVALADVEEVPQVTIRRASPLTSGFIFRRLPGMTANDDALGGGPDDDDFRPSPDRSCALSVRGAACLQPLSFRSVDWALTAGVGPDHSGLPQWRGCDLSSANARTCPALDTSVQILC
jgi:hypothetical protein